MSEGTFETEKTSDHGDRIEINSDPTTNNNTVHHELLPLERDPQSDDLHEENLCSICLDPLPSNTHVLKRSTRQSQVLAVVKPCNHEYHDFCIKSWSERANTCPTCRGKFNSIVLTTGDGEGNATEIDHIKVKDKVFPTPEENFDDIIWDDEDAQDYDDYNDQDYGNFDPDYLPRSSSSYLVPYSVCILCDEMSSVSTGLVVCSSCSGSFHPNCLGNLSHADNWNCPMCDSVQSSNRIIFPSNVARQRFSRASGRAINSFISTLRNEIRTNRRNALGLPFEPISRRQRSLRRGNNSNNRSNIRNLSTGMFLPTSELSSAPQTEPPVSKEEADAWRLYDKAKRSDSSSRQVTPIPPAGSSSSDKKVKKPVRRKHKDALATKIAHEGNQVRNVSRAGSSSMRTGSNSTFSSLLATINSSSLSSARQRPTTSDSHSPTSHSSHETSPTSASLSSDDEMTESNGKAGKTGNASGQEHLKLTIDALSRHNSTFNSPTLSSKSVSADQERSPAPTSGRKPKPRSNSRQNSELTLSQKQLLQKLLVRSKLRPFYNSKKIDADQYTQINKSVSRKLYKSVEDHELHGDYRFIAMLNKLIELRERYEHESYDEFAKRILSDSYTSLEDRMKLDAYALFVDRCIGEETNVDV